MTSVLRIKALQDSVEKAKKKYAPNNEKIEVLVGYTANYAIYVHEIPPTKKQAEKMGSKRTAKHTGNHGKAQWKFLETPARQNRTAYANIIKENLANGRPLLESLYLAGNELQKDSQRIVPIDTGNLRASAFTAKASEFNAVVTESKTNFKKSVAKTKTAKKKK